MCMDLVTGGDLLSLIHNSVRANEENGVMNKACDIATAKFYLAEVSEALEYLHGKGVIHLDLNPKSQSLIIVTVCSFWLIFLLILCL